MRYLIVLTQHQELLPILDAVVDTIQALLSIIIVAHKVSKLDRRLSALRTQYLIQALGVVVVLRG